ncbi:YfcE family phosphodiesterase [Salirhabdus salicampi]|uniref:YfcE family phosphodiesterase n=1 Tax=Salirhabdus salicampi TaxID=476102 RepID=UPI0020C46648|nr:metallophosphoesterase [Salirhabdus salicampi]MCP8617040.1 metallophosphoesterase [Salirhabdus salicampi]
MPYVIVVSDNHGLTTELQQIKEHHPDAKAFIHCGDSELEYHAKEMDQFHKVRGNCDFDTAYPEDINISVDHFNIFVTHGHLYQVKTTLMPLSYRAEELGANVICFGHSHIPGVEQVGDRLYLNPGSIRIPRGGTEKTYAKVSWNDENSVKVEFLNLDAHAIPTMTREFLL